MLLNVDYEFGSAPVLRVSGSPSAPGSMQVISAKIQHLRTEKHFAVCIDLSKCTGDDFSCAFCIVEVVSREVQTSLAFFGAPKGLMNVLQKTDMLRFLNIHLDKTAAQASLRHQIKPLAGTDAVVLCAGLGTRMAPVSKIMPKPMLNVLGKPVLARLVDHLAHHGISRVSLNPGHLAGQIPRYFKTYPTSAQISYFPEGDWHQRNWKADPAGSASTLANLYHRHHAISGDVIVICGDALTNIDLTEMMLRHRQSGAEITIAAKEVPDSLVSRYGIIVANENDEVVSFQEKPSRQDAKSNLANVGIYIISEKILAEVPLSKGMDIANDILTHQLSSVGSMTVFRDEFEWLDLGSCQDYASVIADLLNAPRKWLDPIGNELRPGLWVHETAKLEKLRSVSGPAYIGANSIVSRSAKVIGPSQIGTGCVLDQKTRIENSIVLSGTHLVRSKSIKDVIACEDWTHDLVSKQPSEDVRSWPQGNATTQEPTSAPLLRAS